MRGVARLAARSSALRTQTRHLWGVSTPETSAPTGVLVTKYRITKPANENSTWDDFLLALPERDHLQKGSKEVPIFIRYFRLVAEKEDRMDDFKEFLERAKAGLTVENDVFITTEELLAVMWKNGYSEAERNAVQMTFPSTYKFHYPELAALFDLSEEETYKFCMRTRMEKSHIGELDAKAVARKGFIRDHWLIFGTSVYLFKNFPFFNYYFGVKIFGTGMWAWTNWMLMNRWIGGVSRRNEYMAAQKNASEIMEGEDKLIAAMQRFANDGSCLTMLQAYKAEAAASMAKYRQALAESRKRQLTDSVEGHLASIAAAEAQMGAQLQALVATEINNAFTAKFAGDSAMQKQSLQFAIAKLSGKDAEDPVAKFFVESLGQVSSGASGELAKRISAAETAREEDFKKSFYVSKAEAAEIKKLGADIAANRDKLKELALGVAAKTGINYAWMSAPGAIEETSDAAADAYLKTVNSAVADAAAKLEEAQLKAFVASV